MKTLFCRVVLVCLAILLVAGASFGQVTDNTTGSGNWSAPATWSLGLVPNNGNGGNNYNVVFLTSSGATVTLDISPTIDMLTLQAGTNLQASTVTSGLTLTTTGLTTAGDITLNNNDTLIVNGTMANTASNAVIDLDKNTTLTVNGSFTNSGIVETNIQNLNVAGHPNTITVTGTFTNNAGANLSLGFFGNTTDLMTVGTLVNSGLLTVNNGATLNMTSQPNGITDVVAGSGLSVFGTLSAGANNGLFKLGSVEGILTVGSGQTFTDTPGSGTLTISSSGELDLENFTGTTTAGTRMTVSGNLTNNGQLYTNIQNHVQAGKFNTLTVTGTFTNNSGATTHIGFFNDTTDVMNVATLVNNGVLEIDNGATLNLTAQPNGVTDVVSGSQLLVYGTLKAGSANGLAQLGSVEGTLVVGSGQTFTDTPGGGTLTISSSGELDLENFNGTATAGTSMTVSGNLTNNGQLYTNIQNHVQAGKFNTLTVTGTFTNNSGATTHIGFFNDTTDVMNVATLVNNGVLEIDDGATLNLTSQPNGVTDVASGSQLFVYGALNAGANNGLAKLGSVEGTLVVGSGQTFTDTPGSGTLTISSSGELDLENFNGSTTAGTSLTVSGNLTNSGQLYTNIQNHVQAGKFNTLTVTGTFTNNSGATTHIGFFGDTTDVMNVATLVNNGVLQIDPGATLNLTAQPNGVTDVVAGSQLFVYGTLNAGATNGLAKLGSIEGLLVLGNGQTTSITPTGGTLTISSGGELDLENFIGTPTAGTNVTINGALTNSGLLYTNVQNRTQGKTNTLTVTGNFINSAGATTHIGFFGDTTDIMNVATLVNNGVLEIDNGATLNLTSQPNGVTDVFAGSQLLLYGTLNAGPNNGLAKLTSIEGTLFVGNGQTTNITPMGGTLTISSVGALDLENFTGTPTAGTNVTITGNLTNAGTVETNVQDHTPSANKTNTLTVTGTFTNSGTTKIGVFDNTTDVMNVGALSNSGTISVDPGATFNITSAGTATNNGTINVGDTNGAGSFKINGITTLTGTTGKVILSNFAGNIIGGTGTLTNVKNTISGSGNIGNGTMGLNNQGTIDANQSVPLIIQALGTVSNSLTMEATNGAILQLDAGNYTQTSAGSILASETGNLTSAVDLESGVSITGGKLTITGTTATVDLVGTNPTLTLNGVSISGTGKLILPDGSTTTLLGTISNTSTIDVNGASAPTKLVVGAASVSLTGTGKIILSNNANNEITGAAAAYILHNGNTIEGAGNIGEANMGLVNTGTILANQTTLLEIDVSSAGFNNQGIVQANTNDTLYITGAANSFLNFSGTTLTGGTYIADGTLKFDGANIVTNAANITLSGVNSKIIDQTGANALLNFATNNGTFAIAAGRNFTTMGAFTNNGTLNVGGGTKFLVGTSGMSNLTNFSGTTLNSGTYIVAGTLQFNGANIVTNDASITLSGAAAKIEDQTSANALAGFATNGSGATFDVTSGNVFTTAGSFTNNGTLIVGSSTSKFIVNAADLLTNFSGTTLTGGTYDVTGLLQFAGANIVTNAANITLTGTAAAIENSTAGNGLANFAVNNSGASFDVTGGNVFTTGGNFTNNGTLTVGSSSSKFIVNSANTLTNFSGTTLTGGTYNVTGLLQFAGANIVNNAANITLTGTTSAIENSTNGNGLANFANNTSTGSFTLAGNRTFTTVGAFTNAGVMIINKGSTFTVTGASNTYSQSAGSTTVDGTLTVNAASMINITSGNLFGATGNINGNVDLTGGVVNPGDGVNLIGELKITGTYTQGSAGATTIDLGGKTAITQYSVLDITKAATLSGTLNVTLVNGFTPVAGNQFIILDYLSTATMFTTTNLPTVAGDHWTVAYNAKDLVLTLVAGPGANVIVDNLTSDPTSSAGAPVTVSASPARRVSRSAGVLASLWSTHEPVAILSHVTCFTARLLGSASCDRSPAAVASRANELHAVASAGPGLGTVHNNVMSVTASRTPGAVHNNVMIASRSIASARGGASREASVSATAMARFYVCAYLPSSVGHTMGCN